MMMAGVAKLGPTRERDAGLPENDFYFDSIVGARIRSAFESADHSEADRPWDRAGAARS
jgi:hypothetical protein